MSDIPVGKIKFYDYYKPRLSAGAYTIEVEQSIDLSQISELSSSDSSSPVKTFEKATRTFHVVAPRFRLGPNEVHAVYPPANSEGSYEHTLPHIVLRERTLPWARSMDKTLSEEDDAPLPWVALLLFHGTEAPDVNLSDFEEVKNPPNAAGPDPLDDEQGDSAGKVRTIDIPAALFYSIVPQVDELPLLTHVRQVNTGDKELLGLKEDGWFSVVIGNRLPKANERNTAHLVSLEGWHSFLTGTRPLNGSVRLVSLANWSFWTTAQSGSFQELMEAIDSDVLRVELTDEQQRRLDPDASTQAEQLVKHAIHMGYVALNYETRHGEATAGWYRGPLLPVKTPQVAKDPYESAEAALIYDERTGLFDTSYAVAWQIGRLLALSDGHFTTALQNWRRDGQRMVDRLLENLDLANRYDVGLFLGRTQLDALDEINAEINALADPDNLPADVADKLRSIQEKLNDMPKGMAQPDGNSDSSSPESAETLDFETLVGRVEAYLQKLIDDVKNPRARLQHAMKVFNDEVQEGLLLSADAPLASAPIDKSSLTEGLPQLSPEDIKKIAAEPDMLQRAELIRKALLPEADAGTVPPESS